jgi:hypothetical protein
MSAGASREEIRRRLDRLAWLLDSSIPLPVGDFRIGIDSIVGLIPGIGDAAGAAVSLYILAEAWRLGVSRRTLAQMGFNILLELVVGTIPLAGDLFDMAFKANQRNVRLIHRSLDDRRRTARTSGFVLAAVALALFAAAAFAVAAGMLLAWIIWALATG